MTRKSLGKVCPKYDETPMYVHVYMAVINMVTTCNTDGLGLKYYRVQHISFLYTVHSIIVEVLLAYVMSDIEACDSHQSYPALGISEHPGTLSTGPWWWVQGYQSTITPWTNNSTTANTVEQLLQENEGERQIQS